MDFTEDQLQRYSRHIILPEVGGKGQKKILNARFLLSALAGLDVRLDTTLPLLA